MAYNATQAKRLNAGLCMDCGAARGADGTATSCRPCAAKKSKRASERVARARLGWQLDESLCNSCGGKLSDLKFKTCAKCRGQARGRLSRHMSADGYVRPSVAPTPDRREKRRQASHARKARYTAEGLCASCQKPTTHASLYCRRHWLANMARKYKFPADRMGDLWGLLERQHFQCYYTGVALVPGENASLDHKTPRSRGGSLNDVENCVWADRAINAFKGDLTAEEFVARCKTIASRFG